MQFLTSLSDIVLQAKIFVLIFAMETEFALHKALVFAMKVIFSLSICPLSFNLEKKSQDANFQLLIQPGFLLLKRYASINIEALQTSNPSKFSRKVKGQSLLIVYEDYHFPGRMITIVDHFRSNILTFTNSPMRGRFRGFLDCETFLLSLLYSSIKDSVSWTIVACGWPSNHSVYEILKFLKKNSNSFDSHSMLLH